MVHALDEAHRTLEPGAALIDLRPTACNRRVEIVSAGLRHVIGEIDSSKALPSYAAAEATVLAALAARQFRLEERAAFEQVIELDSPADLREYAAGLRRSRMPAQILPRAERMLARDPSASIELRRATTITRYRKLPAS